MKTRITILMLIGLLIVAGSACAGTYQFRVPQLETYAYDQNVHVEGDVNLGQQFSSITQARFRWTGFIQDGVAQVWVAESYYDVFYPYQVGVNVSYGTGGGGHTNSTNDAGSWDETISLATGTYGGLLDGTFHYVLESQGRVPGCIGPPGFWINEFYVVVDGTLVVPEPSSVMALAGGLLALGGMIRRRK